MTTTDPVRAVPPGGPGLSARTITLARGLILLAAFVSFVFSISLWFSGNELEGVFVGIWVPSIISLGAFLMPWSRAAR
jgi:hypothetical protein